MPALHSRRPTPLGPLRAWAAAATRRGRLGALLVGAGIAAIALGLLVGEVWLVAVQPPFAVAGMVAIVVGGGLVVHAVVRQGERSPLVLWALLPVLMLLFLLVGELVGHD